MSNFAPSPEPFIGVGWTTPGVSLHYFDGEVDIRWADPLPRTLNIGFVDAELMEILFGQPVVPICLRQISAQGEN